MTGQRDQIWLLDHGDIAGGGQRFGVRLAAALRDRGVAVSVGTPAESPMARLCRAQRIDVMELRFPALNPLRVPSITAGLHRMRQQLRALGADATVIANHPRAGAYAFAASRGLAGAPAIVHVMHERESARRISARFALRRSGSVMAVGSNAADEYRRRLRRTQVIAVNNFLSREYLSAAAARPPHPKPERDPVLGVLGRMIPEKGIAELVEELASPEARQGWSELVVGAPFQDPRYVRRVEEAIHRRGLQERIRLLGEVDDVPAFLESVDVLVVPSIGNEAQPTVILEGLAHRVPVLLREPVFSEEFEGLPVGRYRGRSDLPAAIERLRSARPAAEEAARRFGPEQAVAALDRAIQLARARS